MSFHFEEIHCKIYTLSSVEYTVLHTHRSVFIICHILLQLRQFYLQMPWWVCNWPIDSHFCSWQTLSLLLEWCLWLESNNQKTTAAHNHIAILYQHDRVLKWAIWRKIMLKITMMSIWLLLVYLDIALELHMSHRDQVGKWF